MSIFSLAYFLAALVFAVVMSGGATVLLAMRRGDDEDDGREDDSLPRISWRRRLVWLAMLVVGVGLGYSQLGGYYGFVDPRGAQLAFYAHGWPLCWLGGASEGTGRESSFDVAMLWLAIATDLIFSLLVITATAFVVGRCLARFSPRPRLEWVILIEPAGMVAAATAVLLIERWFASPVLLPGSERVIVYTPLVYETWPQRAAVLFGLAALAWTFGLFALRGIRYLLRLRAEGVI